MKLTGGPRCRELELGSQSVTALSWRITGCEKNNPPLKVSAEVYLESLDVLVLAYSGLVEGGFYVRVSSPEENDEPKRRSYMHIVSSRYVEVTHQDSGKRVPFFGMKFETKGRELPRLDIVLDKGRLGVDGAVTLEELQGGAEARS